MTVDLALVLRGGDKWSDLQWSLDYQANLCISDELVNIFIKTNHYCLYYILFLSFGLGREGKDVTWRHEAGETPHFMFLLNLLLN